eukprot:6178226-Pleurochrysis_carterae.AAC.8
MENGNWSRRWRMATGLAEASAIQQEVQLKRARLPARPRWCFSHAMPGPGAKTGDSRQMALSGCS